MSLFSNYISSEIGLFSDSKLKSLSIRDILIYIAIYIFISDYLFGNVGLNLYVKLEG